MILLSSSVTPFARYIDIIAADTQYSRGRPKTTMEALRWSTAKSLDPLIQKKVFESIRWTREEREKERDEPWIEWKKTKREWINEKEKERESKRGFSLDRSCGCQLNVPGPVVFVAIERIQVWVQPLNSLLELGARTFGPD